MSDIVIHIISLPEAADIQTVIRPFITERCKIAQEQIEFEPSDIN